MNIPVTSLKFRKIFQSVLLGKGIFRNVLAGMTSAGGASTRWDRDLHFFFEQFTNMKINKQNEDPDLLAPLRELALVFLCVHEEGSLFS